MTYDHVLERLGEFGRYQAKIYFLLCLPAISCAFHKLAWVFLGAKMKHRCQLPFEETNSSYILDDDIKKMALPWSKLHGTWSSCERLDTNFTDDYFRSRVPAIETVSCTNWIYDKSEYQSSAVMQWDLVCGNAWLRATADSTFMIGVLLGSIIFGDLSDRFGRRPIFFAALVLQVAGGLLAAVAPEFVTFILARMLVGSTTSGVFLVAYVIALEMVGPSKRLLAGVGCQMFFSWGFILTAVLAYFIVDWRWLQAAITLPGVGFLCYWWLIPESSRWLLTKGRSEEAVDILMRVAEQNRVSITREEIHELLLKEDETAEIAEEGESMLMTAKTVERAENLSEDSKPLNQTNGTPAKPEEVKPEEKKATPSVLDLFKYPNLRKRAINIFYNCDLTNKTSSDEERQIGISKRFLNKQALSLASPFVNSATYYGLSWNTSDLGGNAYVNFIICGLVEIPAYSLLLITLNRWGRKFTLCGWLLAAGIALLLTQAVPADLGWAQITLAMFGKMAITSSYGTVYIFTAEQFPTVIRNVGLGAASTSARIGGILTPYFNYLSIYWKHAPLVIFGTLSLTAGLSALQLPETLNRKLPESIEDGERFGRRASTK